MGMKPSDAQFEALVDSYYGELYRFALVQCGRPDLAEDLVQETYARAWGSLIKLKDPSAARAWLFTILRREHARLYERQRPETCPPEELPTVAVYDQRLEPDVLALLEALGGLAETYREPLLLQVVGGFSGAEIGRILGISENTVCTRIYRARLRLRQILEPRIKEVITR